MHSSGVESLQIVFLVLLFLAVAFASLAQRLKTPYPIILVLAGLLLGFAPGIPQIRLDPNVVFYVFLPPLLYSAAWNTSWREFRYNLTSILMLAVGLVAFTVAGVAAAAHYWFRGFDWSSGAVLGAVVATTDAVAATSIARRIGLDRRIVAILEGESLVNDATGLLALEFTTAMVVTNHRPTLGEGSLRLLYLSVIGIAVGIGIGIVVDFLERRIDDGPIEIAISILVAYASYVIAEALDASGVLAVVTCGLYLSRRSVHFFSPGVRMQAAAVWSAIDFVLNGVIFLLIGLQLPHVLAAIRGYDRRSLLIFGALFALLVIALRLVWEFPGARISWWIRRTFLHRKEPQPSARGVFLIGWTGMRGVIALAAALSLPETIATGEPFPNRNLILFLTFSVIVATLVVQGLTLAPLIRLLRLQRSDEREPEEFDARNMILEQALQHLESIRDRDEEFADVYDDVAQHYRTRLLTLRGEGADEHGSAAEHALRYENVTRELLQFERAKAVDLRNSGRISDEILRRLLKEIDLSETRIAQ